VQGYEQIIYFSTDYFFSLGGGEGVDDRSIRPSSVIYVLEQCTINVHNTADVRPFI
jgi:hypothetical protein